MVTDEQVRRLMKFIQKDKSYGIAAAKAGMDEKTARKYHILGKLPSDIQAEHNWRTREDTFSEVWDEVRSHLEINSGLEAKTLFEDLQRRYPGRFSDGQLRTLQRRVKIWRVLEGPPKEVFFPQIHKPKHIQQRTERRLAAPVVLADPFDLTKMLDIPPGLTEMQGVGSMLMKFYARTR